jgi:hypothetical protein
MKLESITKKHEPCCQLFTPEEIAFGNKLMQENGMEGKVLMVIKPLR